MSSEPRAERGRHDACPVVDAFEEIGTQWRLVVLHDLQGQEKRFSEVQASTGASERTLSRVLDDLQEADLVARRIEEDAPVATYYRTTEKGAELEAAFEEIESWAREWLSP